MRVNESKYRSILRFIIWFVFLSTFGVGGGIYFLLFAVVPIEEAYTVRGWSQFRIDSVMKYFVIGWVVFGFVVSWLYYQIFVRKERWKTAIILVILSIFLCVTGLYFFMNTGIGLIQSSQGEINHGERFTFGPYPEEQDLERLKEQGYDGIITLLNPSLPIESPLLEKEKKIGKQIGLKVHSFPMLPWVGNNRNSLDKIKELIVDNEKKYYVHCYLGRHRVDVVKQIINETEGDDYEVSFFKPSLMERGRLINFPEKRIMLGPYPTEEEWFTRIKRGETKEVISLLPKNSSRFNEEKEVTEEMNLRLTHIPLAQNFTREDVEKVATVALERNHPVYIHDFHTSARIQEIEAILDWGKTLHPMYNISLEAGTVYAVGAKLLIGPEPTSKDKQFLYDAGIEVFREIKKTDAKSIYKQLSGSKNGQQLTYITVDDDTAPQVHQIAQRLYYGWKNSEDKTYGKKIPSIKLNYKRNYIIGPEDTEQVISAFGYENGIAQLIYLFSPSTGNQEELNDIQERSKQSEIPIQVVHMDSDYTEKVMELMEKEKGLTYIMVEKELVEYIDKAIN